MLPSLGIPAVRSTSTGRARYQPPATVSTAGLWALLERVRSIPDAQRGRLVLPGVVAPAEGPLLYYAGTLDFVRRKAVAIVGSRKVSAEGARRARRLARELVAAGVVVVSGLAEGVDTNAHEAAIEAGGQSIAVIGTPLERVYPAANAALQETLYRDHLVVTPFAPGAPIYKSNFPFRNRIMATIADATVIIEASDTSGSLHQAAECQRLGRWLFIARSVVDNPKLTWPAKFLGHERTGILDDTANIIAVL